MRTRYSALNALCGVLGQILIALIGFWSRKVFLSTLGLSVQGIYTALTSVITMLSLTELGIGTAIHCNLYRPLADGDESRVCALMHLYGKVYRIIAAVILMVGLCLLPFLPKLLGADYSAVLPPSVFSFVNRLPQAAGVAVVYLVLLCNTAASYLLAYKRSVIVADQRNYLISIVHTVLYGASAVLQILLLYRTKDFLLYLLVRLCADVLENGLLALLANRRYPYIRRRPTEKLDKATGQSIFANTRALALHYVGNYAIDSIDVLIITHVLGPLITGIYANYQLLTRTVKTVFDQFSTSFTASFGNLIAKEDEQHAYLAFCKALFATFCLASVATNLLFCLLQPFISGLWLATLAQTEQVLLPLPTVAVLCLNFFLTCLAETLGSIRAAAGLFRPDRYWHLAMAALNLGISLLLVHWVGLIGVFLGTTVCKVLKELVILPDIVYKRIFHLPPAKYRLRVGGYLGFTVFVCAGSYYLCQQISFAAILPTLILRALVCVAVSCAGILLCFGRTKEFAALINLGKALCTRCFGKGAVRHE